jgi:hypothetical protein
VAELYEHFDTDTNNLGCLTKLLKLLRQLRGGGGGESVVIELKQF